MSFGKRLQERIMDDLRESNRFQEVYSLGRDIFVLVKSKEKGFPTKYRYAGSGVYSSIGVTQVEVNGA